MNSYSKERRGEDISVDRELIYLMVCEFPLNKFV
jgi:hypothetical protein